MIGSCLCDMGFWHLDSVAVRAARAALRFVTAVSALARVWESWVLRTSLAGVCSIVGGDNFAFGRRSLQTEQMGWSLVIMYCGVFRW